ncbi:tetratricopeptide repeat protein [Mucilaginibacter flavus]|uniref:tetratricopeptide repeat protein n=1 Tax=Mucilaginibacter flavus TaxID=931504 RepID=UPI0025B55556|nr:tetratricopeptide repeat protein [Mucilaginibacter flavus]MDN3582836.1 tetratricopeptide repeat protein [Mucilaginibacter flavus]
MINSHPHDLFVAASRLVHEQLLFDAAQQFLYIKQTYPDDELADDALFNAGLCHFHMNSFETAIRIFREIIEQYPEATIYHDEGTNEFGRTAAKAHYSIINCYLGLNQVNQARTELAALKHYDDAYVLTGMNQKISYLDLAQKAIETFEQFNLN